MAQLKDALVLGDARVLGKLYADQSLPDGVFHLANISGTAAVTSSPYTSAKWYTTIDDPRITRLYDGLTISFKIPVASNGSVGTLLNVNGLGQHPVVYNVNSWISTRYSIGSTMILTYNSTQTSTGYENSSSTTTYTGVWQMEDYDSTNVYQLRNSYNTAINSNAGTLYRYEICLSDKDGKLIPYNNTNNAVTTYTKTLNSTPFDPFGPIFYYNSTTDKSAGTVPGTDTMYTHLTFDCRRALNIQSDGTAGTTALTANQPVFIKATYDASTGLATLVNNTSATSYLDRSSIVQALPNADITNCILIYLGIAVSKYQIELSVTHPVYKWDSAKSKWMEFAPFAQNAATVNGKTVAANVPSDAKFTDTTYESKAAASGGTAVSLVTTGEKYTWNNKTSNTGTVTKVSTGAGLTGGDVTTTGTIKCDLKSETKSTLEAASMGSTANRQYAVGLDKNGDLSVNVPWSSEGTTYTFAGGTNGFTVTPSGGSAQTVSVTPSISNNVTGSGTSGYIAKFNGANTITSGPQLGSSETTYLRNDGVWGVPTSGIHISPNAPTDDSQIWVDTSTDIIDIIYPVGAVYFSVDFTNPGLIFKRGTWERMSPDPFENVRVWKRIN